MHKYRIHYTNRFEAGTFTVVIGYYKSEEQALRRFNGECWEKYGSFGYMAEEVADDVTE